MVASNNRHVVPNPKGEWDLKAPGEARVGARPDASSGGTPCEGNCHKPWRRRGAHLRQGRPDSRLRHRGSWSRPGAVEDHGDLPEIDLRLSTQGMLLGNHHLHPIHPQPAASSSDIAAHRALCHLRTVFVDQTFPHPPGRVTLLARRRPIALQPAVDDRRPPIHHRRRTNGSLARHRPPMAGQTTADHRPRHQRLAINVTLISSRSHNDNGKPGIPKSRTVGGGYKHRSS